MTVIRFSVAGQLQTQGSKKAFMRPGMARPVVVDDNKPQLRNWRSDVMTAAREAWTGGILDGDVSLRLTFYLSRPKAHYRSNGDLKPTAPRTCPKKPDIDKLIRAVLDALTDVIWSDDSRVVRIEAEKLYGEPGLHVELSHEGAIREPEPSPF